MKTARGAGAAAAEAGAKGAGARHRASLAAGVAQRLAGSSADVFLEGPLLAAYTTDASNYRLVPLAVVQPRTADDVAATLAAATELGVPITMRGAGTSCAGNAVGSGIVLDTSRHLNAIIELDPEARTARVQGGVVLADLQRAASKHNLRFGPDPSTLDRCTLGGMIGNNACGPHALAYGRTADNVRSLDLLDGQGRRFTAANELSAVPGLQRLVEHNLATIRTEFGRFTRQVSGYGLEHLLPENGHHLARALVGTEGTCGIVLEAELDLVEVAPAAALVVLGYPSMEEAADDVPRLLPLKPLAIEGLDARLVDVVRRVKTVPELPRGAGWLLIEVGGEDTWTALRDGEAIAKASGAIDHTVLQSGPEASALWRIRADGAGLAGRTADGKQAWPGWEDAAVPPEHLGAYLRDFNALTREHGIDGLPYGHFGDGCLHVRLDIPLTKNGRALRAFLLDAAHLVASYGGSLSGEHGDGRARSELLPAMFSPAAIELLGQFKALFDPNDRLNPGVVVKPEPVDAHLRRPAARTIRALDGFQFLEDDGDITTAMHRCVGVGKCRADTSAAGDFMCPSYLASHEEKDVTRGRARVLQEMANGRLVRGWDDPALEQALDLCLACKACSTECPAGVDMAKLRSEALHRRYAGRIRPITHYVLGWLPRWSALATRAPRLVNLVTQSKLLAPLLLRVGGMDPRRSIPRFAPRSFHKAWRRQGGAEVAADGAVAVASTAAARPSSPLVVLWADSFSDALSPSAPMSAARVLRRAGYDVIVPSGACCGLTWITTGQLTAARDKLLALLAVLGPFAVNGIDIVGIEPSCTAVLRSDLLDLVPGDVRAQAVAERTHTLAEFLTSGPLAGAWTPPDLSGVSVIAQPHCHHHSVMGYGADLRLLERCGADVAVLAGCCGLAGNFGMEKGHHEMSLAVAENSLAPALRGAQTDAVFLADGFSCRTQGEFVAGRRGMHLAELLDGGARRREGAYQG